VLYGGASRRRRWTLPLATFRLRNWLRLLPMTLAVGWVREVGTGPELVFAADSRLRQGGAWDSCPKIFRLPRSDAVMAFAGDTLWAYPIVLQTINDIDAFPPSRRRQSDLRVARGHALRVLNQMLASGDALSSGLHKPDTEFLFGGWSWEAQRFFLWRLHWSTYDHGFRHETQRRQRWTFFVTFGFGIAMAAAWALFALDPVRIYLLVR
jgi:hypothetical protein